MGLKGGLKLNLQSNCLECLTLGASVQVSSPLKPAQTYTIHAYEHKTSLLFLEGISTREQAQGLVGSTLKMSAEETLRLCNLQEGEFLAFQLVGLEVIEEGEVLGVVLGVESLAGVDYLQVQARAKKFLIPYIPRYIIRTDLESKRIDTRDALGLLEES
ncbi:16S rRNA processing protein RimM [Helicobacter sp. NHP21005]|uniref:ribosome maturation factor RimM n=1 Tax=Helicobacter felistomachi TaxID=3040201 RepID=UPI0025747520|nr:ribosome maturation factor RimM [Helicobacter sp. NHP21005]BEG57073.1 16S rRNA processing protein RimM [Helicobacter sp. NHP21005]